MTRPQAKETKALVIHLPPALYNWLHQTAIDQQTTKTALVVAALEKARRFSVTTTEVEVWPK